jgi:DNA (cytosine-5)-methyltransferase 1
MGYHLAGYDVVGIDIVRQPLYPFEFIQMDALVFIEIGGCFDYDAIHASPPCQAYSWATRINKNPHPDYIPLVRECLMNSNRPYVIENVPGAPLQDPVLLCGTMFNLKTYRHRLFETNWPLKAPEHPEHHLTSGKMGRPTEAGKMFHAVGNFSDAQAGREALQIDWLSRPKLREAIPPAYTKYIGEQMLSCVLG